LPANRSLLAGDIDPLMQAFEPGDGAGLSILDHRG
jgi:hypothetical protein